MNDHFNVKRELLELPHCYQLWFVNHFFNREQLHEGQSNFNCTQLNVYNQLKLSRFEKWKGIIFESCLQNYLMYYRRYSSKVGK